MRDPRRYLGEQDVACLMAALVVDVFEAVEVEEEHRRRAADAAAGSEALFEHLVEPRTIREAGQWVRARRGPGRGERAAQEVERFTRLGLFARAFDGRLQLS